MMEKPCRVNFKLQSLSCPISFLGKPLNQAVGVSPRHQIGTSPVQPKEQQRIVDAGGFVTFNGVWRVAGVLATSRAFCDYPLKQRRLVTVEQEFRVYDIQESKPHFIILATDGLWDVFSNEDAVRFISERLDEPHLGAKSLALQAYYRGSLDNITVMVINFKKKRALQRKFDKKLKHLSDTTSESNQDESK